ncbi:protein phosphatase CheZ [Natronospira bacteriovora]|uniref:Protein phosphatase CheZ n=1 Tax=Natronospira bacteriovora TaxID=3069753 RepID=A0ABU0W4T5_9GAMM|nr:protein phosphatase CheZ [Natronospira sp. AB-CW4]MDQ2068455.1 protein phosphatase CheZ [Natronospira sp. AB-CW4]
MAFDDQKRADDYRERVQRMAQALESGDERIFNEELDELTHIREKELFVEVGKLTRELHDALKSFRMDFRLAELAEKEMPDARDRLNYVVEMTEKAAHTTLETVESLLPRAESMGSEARTLAADWERFLARNMAADEFRQVARRLQTFLGAADSDVESIRGGLTEILMAQEYQDLTGQIISRVISMVQELEEGMVDLLRVAGGKQLKSEPQVADKEEKKPEKSDSRGHGPATPSDQAGDVAQGQDEVDDLLSSLGF